MSRSQLRLMERTGVGTNGVAAVLAGVRSSVSLAQQYRAAVAADAAVLPTLPDTDAPPVNTVAPAITGDAEVGETLTCSAGTWTGDPTPSAAAFQWLRDGRPINGATAATYELAAADLGARVGCVVRRENIYGLIFASAAPTAAVVEPE